MSAPITFHVPPDAGPDAIAAIFSTLCAAGESGLPSAALRERVSGMLGKQPRGEALALSRDLKLVEQGESGVRLTQRGALVGSSADWADLVHGLSYVAWSAKMPGRLSRMWTYRTVTDLLWEAAPIGVGPALKKQLVEELLARAAPAFATVASFDPSRTSLGPKSIDGVQRWLARLTPTVVHNGRIMRRQRCPPVLLVLVLAAAAQTAGAEPGIGFRLGPEQRDLLCRACFLEPVALDAMLEWTVQTQPHRVRWSTENARYGRQLVLLDHKLLG